MFEWNFSARACSYADSKITSENKPPDRNKKSNQRLLFIDAFFGTRELYLKAILLIIKVKSI